jgi:hypothetical protein
VDTTDAAGFIPEAWTAKLADMTSRSFLTEHYERQRLGDEVGFGGDWDTVVFPDGEEFWSGDHVVFGTLPSDASFERGQPHPIVVMAKKVVKVEVPDEAAIDDLDALLRKWRAEGKEATADAVDNYDGDGCGCCASDRGLWGVLVTTEDRVVEREAPADECKFYLSSRSRPMEQIAFRKLGNIDVKTADYKAFVLTADDYNRATGFDEYERGLDDRGQLEREGHHE